MKLITGASYILFAFVLCLLLQKGESITKNPRLVCYYFNWSFYRPGLSRYTAQNINPYLCTHLIYAYAAFTTDFRIKSSDKAQDLEIGGYRHFTKLKESNPNLKLLVALGGSVEASIHYSPLARNDDSRKKFAKDAVKFLRQHQFDGLDLVWQYPAYREGSSIEDKANYVKLLKEVREEFAREAMATNTDRYLISVSIPSNAKYIEKGFDIEALNNYVDWFNLIAYDYHNPFEPFVNHHAPLFAVGNDPELNVDFSVQSYLKAGAESLKINVGLPTYGRSFTLRNTSDTGFGAPSSRPGAPSNTTRENGALPYYELCSKLKNEPGWTIIESDPARVGPYAYKDDFWIGYDNEQSARLKARYVLENDLGGMLIWAVNYDDYRGTCTGKSNPLVEAVKETLFSSNEVFKGTTTPEPPTTPNPGADFECIAVGLFPHPTNNANYYQCDDSGPIINYGVTARELFCPSKMLFNPESKKCEIIDANILAAIAATKRPLVMFSKKPTRNPEITVEVTSELLELIKPTQSIQNVGTTAKPSPTRQQPAPTRRTPPPTPTRGIPTSPPTRRTPPPPTPTRRTPPPFSPTIQPILTNSQTFPSADSSNRNEIDTLKLEISDLKKLIANLQGPVAPSPTQSIIAGTAVQQQTPTPNRKTSIANFVNIMDDSDIDDDFDFLDGLVFTNNNNNNNNNNGKFPIFTTTTLNGNDKTNDQSSFFNFFNTDYIRNIFNNAFPSTPVTVAQVGRPDQNIDIETYITDPNSNDILISRKVDKTVRNKAYVLPQNGQRGRIIVSSEREKNRKNILSKILN